MEKFTRLIHVNVFFLTLLLLVTSSYNASAATTDICGIAYENEDMTLTCLAGQVITEVGFASYGTPTGSCGSFVLGSCNSSKSVAVVSSACQGKNSCTLKADNATFDDPCYGTFKKLAAQVACGMATDNDSTQNVSVDGVAVTPANATLTVGTSISLSAMVVPSDASNKNLSWSSSASGVATVNWSGIVTGVSAGTAIITVTTEDGGHRATSTINVLAASVPDNNSGVTSLKSLAVFPIGVAVNAGSGTNNIINSDTSAQQQTIAFTHFNQMTAGNNMKMSYLHPYENTYTFDQADAFVSFANANGIAVHGHTLIWHSDYQVPSFMKNYSGDFAAMLKDHVQTIASHYSGKVVSWDVVNEALADSDSGTVNGLRDSLFYQKMGEDYIDQAFINARAADPTADLFYNDYSIENGGTKTYNMLSLVDRLKARGVPITGVGFQMHILSTWPSISAIEKAMKDVADRGLKVKITELDVRVNNLYDSSAPVYTSLTSEAAEIQKERYRQVVAAYLRAVPPAQRAGITVWGIWDADSWLNTPENPDWPLLFDVNFQPKPALQGFADGLTGK